MEIDLSVIMDSVEDKLKRRDLIGSWIKKNNPEITDEMYRISASVLYSEHIRKVKNCEIGATWLDFKKWLEDGYVEIYSAEEMDKLNVKKKLIPKVKAGFLESTENYYYSSCVEVNYGTEYDCHNNGCEYICRCGKIVDTEIESINTWKLAKNISPEDDELLIYCIDRILVDNEIYESHKWTFDIGGGYYGEELNGIYFDNVIKINSTLTHLYNQKTESDRIKFVLVEEYGYLLDSIRDLTFSLETVKRADIKIPNESYTKKVDPGVYQEEAWILQSVPSRYTKLGKLSKRQPKPDEQEYVKIVKYSYAGPMGVVKEDSDGNLILVDGYHRYNASEKEDEVKIVIGRYNEL